MAPQPRQLMLGLKHLDLSALGGTPETSTGAADIQVIAAVILLGAGSFWKDNQPSIHRPEPKLPMNSDSR